MVLNTERTKLRRFEAVDLESVYAWGKIPVYHQMAGYPILKNRYQALQVLETYMKQPYSFAVVLKKTQRLIGLVELNERGLDERSGLLQTKELGFLLDQHYWHQGIMTEVLHTVIDYAFTNLKITELWAGAFTDNDPSNRLLLKLGFTYQYQVDYSLLHQGVDYVENYYLLRASKTV